MQSERLGIAAKGLWKYVRKVHVEYNVWFTDFSAIKVLRNMFYSGFQKHYPDIQFSEVEKQFGQIKKNSIQIEFGGTPTSIIIFYFRSSLEKKKDTGEVWKYEGDQCKMHRLNSDLEVYELTRRRHENEKVMAEAHVTQKKIDSNNVLNKKFFF